MRGDCLNDRNLNCCSHGGRNTCKVAEYTYDCWMFQSVYSKLNIYLFDFHVDNCEIQIWLAADKGLFNIQSCFVALSVGARMRRETLTDLILGVNVNQISHRRNQCIHCYCIIILLLLKNHFSIFNKCASQQICSVLLDARCTFPCLQLIIYLFL